MKSVVKILLLDDDAARVLDDDLFFGLQRHFPRIQATVQEHLHRFWVITLADAPLSLHVDAVSETRQAASLVKQPDRLLEYDLVLVDNDWVKGGGPQDYGMQLLAEMDKPVGGPLIAMYSARDIGPDFVSRAFRAGAKAFASKGEHTHLLNLLMLAISHADARALESYAAANRDAFIASEPILQSETPRMKECMQAAALFAQREARPILIGGETGTGKTTLARAIHRASSRGKGPIEIMDLAAIPPELIASHLYGTVEGAFTGAQTRTGVLEAANGGTLFIDDLQNASLEVQQKIHSLLDNDATYRRLGDDKPRRVNVRFIFATNMELDSLVKSGRFKLDLMQRIAVLRLELPPLRERSADIERLATDLLREQWKIDHPEAERPKLTAEAVSELLSHQWPGNIRELRNAMSRVSALASGTQQRIEITDIRRALHGAESMDAPSDDDRRRFQALSLRNGSQRLVLDRLSAAPSGCVSIEELNDCLGVTDGDQPSMALQSAISRLRPRLSPLGFEIEHSAEGSAAAYCLKRGR